VAVGALCWKKLDRPTPLDTDLMRALEYFGVADAYHLAALIGGNVDWIERRLHLLYDTEYLERLTRSLPSLPATTNGASALKAGTRRLPIHSGGADHLARIDGELCAKVGDGLTG
jgi:hypothetical protein